MIIFELVNNFTPLLFHWVFWKGSNDVNVVFLLADNIYNADIGNYIFNMVLNDFDVKVTNNQEFLHKRNENENIEPLIKFGDGYV